MANITDVDQFDATIEVPTGGQLASAVDIRDKFVQKLANRTRWLYNRLLVSKSAQYTISGTGLALDALATLTQDFASSGFSVASNLVTVPQNGTYRVSVTAPMFEQTDATAGYKVGCQILRNATTYLMIIGERARASTAAATLVSGSCLVPITDYTTQTIRVRVGITSGCTSGIGIITDDSKLSIDLVHS